MGGEIIFQNALDRGLDGVNGYFESLGFIPATQVSYATVEWLVELTSGKAGEHLGRDVNQHDFIKSYKASALCSSNNQELADALAMKDSLVVPEASHSNNMCSNILVLLRYRTWSHYQSPEFLGPRFGDKIFSAVLILSLYWDIGSKTDSQSMQSTAALLYFIVALCGYGAAAFVPSLTLDRPLFYRERADGLYTTPTYFIAKFLEEAILCTITSLIFGLIVFFACSFQGSFGVFIGIYYLTTMIGIVLAYAVAAAVPTMDAANALLPTYVTICMYFGGFFLLYQNLPIGWKWFSYTAFLRYSWCPLMINQFDNDKFNDITTFDGNNILQFYDLDDGFEHDNGISVAMLVVLLVVFSLLGVIALKFCQHSTR